MEKKFKYSTMKDFEVIKKVGEGSYGKVYKVRRKSDQKIYAIKTINISTMDKTQITNTLNEVRILCSLNQSYVVGYKEAFINKNGKEMCLVMEYVGGGDMEMKINKYLKKKVLMKEEKVWIYLVQCLAGLKTLHDLKIIHRDIKSANLFLSSDHSVVKLGDLNVAKIAKNDFAQTQIGTPYYLAPEIWNNEIYDYKCDIFSLGCVIYEMAALKIPFKGKNL